MKTKIILTRGQVSAEVELSYTDPFEDVSFKSRGDMLLIKLYAYYLFRRGSMGYFMRPATVENIESHFNILPMLQNAHGVSAQIRNPPPLERFIIEDEDPLAVY